LTAIANSRGSLPTTGSIVVAANFTADLLEEAVRFWLDDLEIPCEIEFAPYSQVFQQLLDPASLFGRNAAGLNVVLIRVEEWWRAALADGKAGISHEQVERNAQDFLTAIGSASERLSVPLLICFCPSGTATQTDKPLADYLGSIENKLAAGANQLRGIDVVTSAELASLYPVADYEDVRADKVGHVPYTQEFFNVLGTMVARRFYRLQSPPYKIIVLDCDNTLWRGVCGEDGALGVKVDLAARALQEFVIAQRNAGMLLCLCSKNNEEDAWKVFAQNSGMVLRRDHIVAFRINWLPKSENLRSLAAELQLGLDSFILLDDNAMECAEVEARCPEVLALEVPQEAPAASKFLAHVWAFDHLPLTEEDRVRSAMYGQNADREALRKKSMSLDDFLAGLELQLEILPMEKGDLARVAQLTQRTNQFNFTAIRRSENEIERLCSEGVAECLVVKLRDRFGDYGTVGTMIFVESPGLMEVDSILLSCRALGRRVEQRMLGILGTIAQQRGIERVRLNFSPTPKNKPAREFLESIGAKFEQPDRASYFWDFPPAALIAIPSTTPSGGERSTTVSETAVKVESNQFSKKSSIFVRIAAQLSDAASISRAVAARRAITHRNDDNYLEPGTPFEKFLATTWMKFLQVDRVGVADNFFDLGGQSLSAMQVAFKIEEEFHIDFSLDTFLQSPVLADQAQRLEDEILGQADPNELERLVDEMEKTAGSG
jgi:FkbH-like protein